MKYIFFSILFVITSVNTLYAEDYNIQNLTLAKVSLLNQRGELMVQKLEYKQKCEESRIGFTTGIAGLEALNAAMGSANNNSTACQQERELQNYIIFTDEKINKLNIAIDILGVK